MSNPNDYTVSLYTYCKGKLGTVIENWSYGMGGAIVYEYLPHKNVICIQGCDIADTWTESYYKINKMELVSKQSLTTYNFKDKIIMGCWIQMKQTLIQVNQLNIIKMVGRFQKKNTKRYL